MERSFFDQVLDVVETMTADRAAGRHAVARGRGLKVWFGDADREHYEAQLIRVDGGSRLEIGFHAEHPKREQNEAVLAALDETAWRRELGREPVAGAFLGADRWRRISEVWDVPESDDVDAVIDVAARLSDYVAAIEPLRTGAFRS